MAGPSADSTRRVLVGDGLLYLDADCRFLPGHRSNALVLMAVKGKVDFPQIGFEKGTTERGVSKVSKSC